MYIFSNSNEKFSPFSCFYDFTAIKFPFFVCHFEIRKIELKLCHSHIICMWNLETVIVATWQNLNHISRAHGNHKSIDSSTHNSLIFRYSNFSSLPQPPLLGLPQTIQKTRSLKAMSCVAYDREMWVKVLWAKFSTLNISLSITHSSVVEVPEGKNAKSKKK